MYLLDTDHLVVLQRQSAVSFDNLVRRLTRSDPDDVYVSIVSFHEHMQGWLALLNRGGSSSSIVFGYAELEAVGRSFFQMNVLSFTDEAQKKFDYLRQQKIRIGTMDLRIASIALTEGATVLTANTRDFEKVPGLAINDWTHN